MRDEKRTDGARKDSLSSRARSRQATGRRDSVRPIISPPRPRPPASSPCNGNPRRILCKMFWNESSVGWLAAHANGQTGGVRKYGSCRPRRRVRNALLR